ncbi:hypothetical protein PIROE2DRAFT_6430 [Piromyces sp. E2]|nr:hypothetical protein PIROE2DRAFT_6430 [Piromyces sp. E2]|eukprot:OUM66385.1 hypothetical protein PIROE2DRAFT_6430 [Piromyces sp. E2]
MEVLYETLDLLDQYEKERKNTISMNSSTTVVQKEEVQNQNEEEKNPRESTAESNITRINSTRSSTNSFEARTNSDIESDTDVESDEEFKSFPDDTSLNYQNDKENLKYDANYYEYMSQKNNGVRINSLPVTIGNINSQRSRSNSSLSTPELLIYDSNEYDSSSSYSSFNERKKYNQSFTFGSGGNNITNLPKSNKIVNKSLSGNKIFQNNQLLDSCETLLNDMEENFPKRNSNSNSSSASSDLLIPQRGISLLDSPRKARHKSYAGPSKPSPIPSPAVSSPKSKVPNINTNYQKDTDGSQSDSSKTAPSSPSTPNDSFIGPMSRSFSISTTTSQSGNMSFSSDHNLRPISSLYRNHSLGGHDKRVSRSSRDLNIKNHYTFESNRSRSMSPSHRKPTITVLPGNINANGGVVRGLSSSTPPTINYSEGKVSEIKKEVLSSPLSQNPSTIPTPFNNTPPQSPRNDNMKLPHKYSNNSFLESESNVKEAGSHIDKDSSIQNQNIIEKSFIDNVSGQNMAANDNRVSVQNSTVSIQSVSTVSTRMNMNESSFSGMVERSNTNDAINKGLMTPRSLTGTPELAVNNVIVRDNITLPVNKRKSSIPKKPILYQEPFTTESSKSNKITNSFTKNSEKEVFDSLIQLLDQLENHQQQNKQEPIDVSATDVSIHKALNHLEKSYFPEGREYIPKSPLINNNINEREIIGQVSSKEYLDRVPTPTNMGVQSDSELMNMNKNSNSRLRGQEELQRILNNSAPSYYVKAKKERTMQPQQYKFIQLQQKQDLRMKKIQHHHQQQQQQQQLQNHLKQQINQKLQQNAMIQQKLKQLGNDPNSMSNSPSLRMINPEYDYNSPMSEISVNDFSDVNPRRYDSITPVISPVSTFASIDSNSVVSIPTRPRKSSINNQQYIPQVNNGKEASPLSNSYDSSMKDFKSNSPGISAISIGSSSKISPNQSFTSMPVMVPNLGYSPSVQSRSFTMDIANESSVPGIPHHKLYSRSPSTQCVDISTSEEAKKQRKSKKPSIFYIPPDNSSKPLTAVVSDVTDVNLNDELDIITKNNTIINSNSNAALNVRTSLYKNNYNLSADNLVLLKERTEVSPISPIKKSNSIGSQLNNYGTVDERQLEFKKNNSNNAEGETFIERFMNELNVTTGFENNILKQRAQQQEEERREMELRRRTFLQNQALYNKVTPTNVKPMIKKDANDKFSYDRYQNNIYYD